MGTSTHMGIWKVVLDICSPSKHLNGISVGENGGERTRRGREEQKGRERKGRAQDNRGVVPFPERVLVPPSSSGLYIICMNGIILALLACHVLFCKLCALI